MATKRLLGSAVTSELAATESFVAYWQHEGERYFAAGHYDWMAAQTPPGFVLEVGCGLGFSTVALLRSGRRLLAIERSEPIVDLARQKVAAELARLAASDPVSAAAETRACCVCAEAGKPDPALEATLATFAPQTLTCWLYGLADDYASQQTSTNTGNERLAAQQRIALWAATLPSLNSLHFVDRSVLPWQARRIAAEVYLRSLQDHVAAATGFVVDAASIVLRKAELRSASQAREMSQLRQLNQRLGGVTPVFMSAVLRRDASAAAGSG